LHEWHNEVTNTSIWVTLMVSDAKWLSSIISAPLLSNASKVLACAAISASNAWCFCILAYNKATRTQKSADFTCNKYGCLSICCFLGKNSEL